MDICQHTQTFYLLATGFAQNPNSSNLLNTQQNVQITQSCKRCMNRMHQRPEALWKLRILSRLKSSECLTGADATSVCSIFSIVTYFVFNAISAFFMIRTHYKCSPSPSYTLRQYISQFSEMKQPTLKHIHCTLKTTPFTSIMSTHGGVLVIS